MPHSATRFWTHEPGNQLCLNASAAFDYWLSTTSERKSLNLGDCVCVPQTSLSAAKGWVQSDTFLSELEPPAGDTRYLNIESAELFLTTRYFPPASVLPLPPKLDTVRSDWMDNRDTLSSRVMLIRWHCLHMCRWSIAMAELLQGKEEAKAALAEAAAVVAAGEEDETQGGDVWEEKDEKQEEQEEEEEERTRLVPSGSYLGYYPCS